MQEVILRTSQLVNLIKLSPTITAPATPYTAGDNVGGIQILANAVSPRGAGSLRSLAILDKSNQKAALDILIFSVSPNAATTTDNAAFVLSTDDLNVIARIAVATGDYVTIGGEAFCQKSGLDLAVQAASGFTLYAVAVTSGTPTYAAGALQFIWGTLTS